MSKEFFIICNEINNKIIMSDDNYEILLEKKVQGGIYDIRLTINDKVITVDINAILLIH